jgi:hypothetical protein
MPFTRGRSGLHPRPSGATACWPALCHVAPIDALLKRVFTGLSRLPRLAAQLPDHGVRPGVGCRRFASDITGFVDRPSRAVGSIAVFGGPSSRRELQ